MIHIIKSFDWQMISFVLISLANEYMVNVHIPKVYYWNAERDYQARKINITDFSDKKIKTKKEHPNDDNNKVA